MHRGRPNSPPPPHDGGRGAHSVDAHQAGSVLELDIVQLGPEGHRDRLRAASRHTDARQGLNIQGVLAALAAENLQWVQGVRRSGCEGAQAQWSVIYCLAPE